MKKNIAKALIPNSEGDAKELEAASVVGKSGQYKALTPRQAYENNIYFRKGVSATATNCAKACNRLFTSNDEEITSGDAFDFVRKNLTVKFKTACFSWWEVEGEIAIWAVPGPFGPQKLVVLDPSQLLPVPQQARTLEDVQSWNYYEPYLQVNKATLNIPTDQVLFISNWNPHHRFRGSSPALTGSSEITQNYLLGRYNTAVFQNGSHRDLIMRFPAGTTRKTVKDTIKEYEHNHGIFSGNAFKIVGLTGDKIQIEEPGMTSRDGQFLELRGNNSNDILALTGCPPVVAGVYNLTRFDSADIELKAYFENKIMVNLHMFSEFIQHQVINRFFPESSRTNKRQVALSKSLSAQLHRAIDDNSESQLIFLADPDSLPIAAEIRMSQLNAVTLARQSMGLSFAEAAEYVGVDRPSNAADDLIYVLSTEQLVAQEPVEAPAPTPEPVEPAPEVDKTLLDAAKAFHKDLRALALEDAAQGRVWSMVKGLKLLKDHGVEALLGELSRLHRATSQVLRSEAEDKVQEVKGLLNAASKSSHVKSLFKGR